MKIWFYINAMIAIGAWLFLVNRHPVPAWPNALALGVCAFVAGMRFEQDVLS